MPLFERAAVVWLRSVNHFLLHTCTISIAFGFIIYVLVFFSVQFVIILMLVFVTEVVVVVLGYIYRAKVSLVPKDRQY